MAFAPFVLSRFQTVSLGEYPPRVRLDEDDITDGFYPRTSFQQKRFDEPTPARIEAVVEASASGAGPNLKVAELIVDDVELRSFFLTEFVVHEKALNVIRHGGPPGLAIALRRL
jgi:hypothetical protein